MMKKVIKLVAAIGVMLTMMTSTAFAAGWTTGQADSSRWWYDLGNGQYYSAVTETPEWQWLDGNQDGVAECYAFDQAGWMYAGTETPDGYRVNSDGAWVVDGKVQTRNVEAGYAGSRAQADQNAQDTQSNQTDTAGNRILIAYFSHTGTTRNAARRIHDVTGADMFEITVTSPYSDSYQSTVNRARQELDQNARPELASSVSNMDDYDVILVGYPIWWHTAPMVIDTFLESYDLTGKKIIPFCTSAGSTVEESMPDIRRLGASRGAEVGSGLTANSSSRSEIGNWLQQNGVSVQK